jgi:hypothetical protein
LLGFKNGLDEKYILKKKLGLKNGLNEKTTYI